MFDATELNRRQWLETSAGILSAVVCGVRGSARAADAKRPRVAAVITEFTYRSHAHVILENFLEPYLLQRPVDRPRS